MTWGRFGYICRKASSACREDESISECLARIEKEEACSLYGEWISADSWQRELLEKIAAIEDSKEAKVAVEIYGSLRLARHFVEPTGFKSAFAYLGTIAVVFFIVAGIYQTFVMPTFLQVYETLHLETPTAYRLVFFRDYSMYFILAVAIFLVFSLVISFALKQMFKFKIGVEDGFIIRRFTFWAIADSYKRLIELLQFPVRDKRGNSLSNSQITTHLGKVERSGMDVSVEMQELIENEMHLLSENCDRQIKYLTTLSAIIILTAVFLFLLNAYSQIFNLGETV